MGNGGYPRTDLNLVQNSKNKIQIFLDFNFLIFCPRFKSVPIAPFCTFQGNYNLQN